MTTTTKVKEPVTKSLFARRVNTRTLKKLDKVSKDTGVAKWVLVDKILSDSLGIKTKHKIDLSKWIK